MVRVVNASPQRPPRVAVPAYTPAARRVRASIGDGFSVPEHYVHALHRAGAVPYLLSAYDPRPAHEVLDDFDGLLLIGGGDIDPAGYGGGRHPELYGIELDRDRFECALAVAAVDRELPLLAICRGMQMLNVALGGTLHPHLPEIPGSEAHRTVDGELLLRDVDIRPGTLLASTLGTIRVQRCSCRHHQSIDRVGRDLEVVARADDGTVEGMERAVPGGWLLGVQWHPEDTAAGDPVQQALFDAFVAEAGAGKPARP